MTVIMSREELDRMQRKSGLIPPTGYQDGKAIRDYVNEPLPEPPKPTFVQAQVNKPAPAEPQVVTPAPAAPEQPAETIVFADLKKEIETLVFMAISANKEQLRGPRGTQGEPGRDVSLADLRTVIAEEVQRAVEQVVPKAIQDALAADPARFRGESGQSVTSEDVAKLIEAAITAQPERFRGEKGEPSTVPGPVGKTVIIEKPVKGDKGDPGNAIVGPRGPAGLDEEQITELVCKILTDANQVSENNIKLLGLTIEMDAIRNDSKYSRLGLVRDELLKRLESRLL